MENASVSAQGQAHQAQIMENPLQVSVIYPQVQGGGVSRRFALHLCDMQVLDQHKLLIFPSPSLTLDIKRKPGSFREKILPDMIMRGCWL